MPKKKTTGEKKKRLSGHAHLKAAGKTAVIIGLTAEQIEALDRACELEGRSRANLVTHYTIKAVMELLGEEPRNPNGK